MNFLHRTLEVDYEDFALIKMFLLVWGFGGKQQRLVVATNGRGWWRKIVIREVILDGVSDIKDIVTKMSRCLVTLVDLLTCALG